MMVVVYPFRHAVSLESRKDNRDLKQGKYLLLGERIKLLYKNKLELNRGCRCS